MWFTKPFLYSFTNLGAQPETGSNLISPLIWIWFHLKFYLVIRSFVSLKTDSPNVSRGICNSFQVFESSGHGKLEIQVNFWNEPSLGVGFDDVKPIGPNMKIPCGNAFTAVSLILFLFWHVSLSFCRSF